MSSFDLGNLRKMSPGWIDRSWREMDALFARRLKGLSLFRSDICTCIIYLTTLRQTQCMQSIANEWMRSKGYNNFAKVECPFTSMTAFLGVAFDAYVNWSLWLLFARFCWKVSICGCCWVLFLLSCKGGKHICHWSVSCSTTLPGQANPLSPRKARTEHLCFHVHCLVHQFRNYSRNIELLDEWI